MDDCENMMRINYYNCAEELINSNMLNILRSGSDKHFKTQLICFFRTVLVWFGQIWLTAMATQVNNLTTVIRVGFTFCWILIGSQKYVTSLGSASFKPASRAQIWRKIHKMSLPKSPKLLNLWDRTVIGFQTRCVELCAYIILHRSNIWVS